MSTASFEQLIKQIEQLTPAEKDQLEQVLHRSKAGRQDDSDVLSPGWARGLVISTDFDEPLDDFKEYTAS